MDGVGAAAMSTEKLSQRSTRTQSQVKVLLVNTHCGLIATFSVHFQNHSPFLEGSVSLCSSDWPGTGPVHDCWDISAQQSSLLVDHHITVSF